MKKTNDCIDFLKGIACILIVFLHVGFPGKFGSYINTLAAIGVPIFFMVSGYFTQTDDINKLKPLIRRRCLHILKMLGVTVILYFANSMLQCWFADGFTAIVQWFGVFTIKNILKLVALNMTSFIEGWGILWFMLALIYCYVAYYILRIFFKKSELYYWLIPVLLGVHLVVRYIFNLVEIPYGSVYFQNWLFDGLPFFLLGNYLFKYANKVPGFGKLSPKALLCVAGLGMVISLVEEYIVGHVSFFFGTVIAVVMLFIFASKNPEFGSGLKIAIIGKKYSMVIYLVHTIVYQWIKVAKQNFLFSNLVIIDWLMPFIVLACALSISVLYDGIFSKHSIKRKA